MREEIRGYISYCNDVTKISGGAKICGVTLFLLAFVCLSLFHEGVEVTTRYLEILSPKEPSVPLLLISSHHHSQGGNV